MEIVGIGSTKRMNKGNPINHWECPVKVTCMFV
jgi:hypothetical protein